jgi:hypothetical protein
VSATLDQEAWLTCVRTSYLDGFIRDGGAALKVAVPMDPGLRESVVSTVLGTVREHGLIATAIKAEDTRVHMIDQVFFHIASAVSWDDVSRRVIKKLAEGLGYEVGEIGDTPLLSQLADLNGIDDQAIRIELRKALTDQVFKEKRLAKDFRVAMFQMCLAQLGAAEAASTTSRVLREWLTGVNPAVSAVKPYNIFNRINRTNARHFLESLLWWVHLAGLPGVAIVFDLGRLAATKNPRDGHQYYTKAMVLDVYELLRQFIDGTDRAVGCLFVVVPDTSFLDEANNRGVSAYSALKTRIFDEVKDRTLVNPLAALVRLSPEGSAV